MTDTVALALTARLLALAVLFQTVEYWQMRSRLRPGAKWDWSIGRTEFHPPLARVLDQFLRWPNVLALVGLRLVAAIGLALVPNLFVALVFLCTTLLLTLRWRGAVNGGSDAMCLVLATALVVATLPHPLATDVALCYIAVQSTLSYWVAGVVKLRSVSWRRGTALSKFVRLGSYPPPTALLGLLAVPRWMRMLSALALTFELGFPLALLVPACTGPMLIAGAVFHLANTYLLGLTRFLWIWLATYPALVYCASQLAVG